jgi:hypothetical protein
MRLIAVVLLGTLVGCGFVVPPPPHVEPIDRDGDGVAGEPDELSLPPEPPYSLPSVEPGVAYRVTINTHCGLAGLEIDGEWWHFDVERPQKGMFADPDVGWLTVIDDTTAKYRSSRGAVVGLTRGETRTGEICV